MSIYYCIYSKERDKYLLGFSNEYYEDPIFVGSPCYFSKKLVNDYIFHLKEPVEVKRIY